jgi:hypothetical protein
VSRWDDIKRTQPATVRVKDKSVLNGVRRLTQNADYVFLLEYFSARMELESVDRTNPNVSALLMTEGRRTLLHELKSLPELVAHERDADPAS